MILPVEYSLDGEDLAICLGQHIDVGIVFSAGCSITRS